LSVAGGIYLAFAVNALTAWLAISTLVSYLVVYTPLKRKTPLCTALGALPGAAPVLIGWAGAAANLNWHAWFLFAILFLWQFPHFLAIALMYREDYARAGYRMLPDFDRDSRFTRAEIISFTVLLILLTLFPLAEHGTPFYWAGMLLSGAFLLFHVGKLAASDSRTLARKVVHATVLYLPVVLAIMVVWKA
jgi:protoheme IX farnesyltransferase